MFWAESKVSDLHDLSLEDIERPCQAGLTWKLIPLYYCPGKEAKAFHTYETEFVLFLAVLENSVLPVC